MNSLKRKALAAAVFAGLGSGAAMAGHVNPAGTGQFLIYPYYTVQQANGNAYNTYVTVVNTTTSGKVVKVRFREGKNSREVLDFNLYLSPNDVWVGILSAADATTASPGRLTTPDTSCTNPAIPATGVDFRNFAMVATEDFVADKSLARTREGYLEMYELATVVNGPNTTLDNITHTAAGVPLDCAAVQGTAPALDIAAPTGGLTGTGTLINVNNGSDTTYNAVAIANFQDTPLAPTLGTEQGNATNADRWSVVTTATADGGPLADRYYLTNWGSGVNAVSAMLMASNVMNEFIIDAATASATDWVVTFPTKRFYYAGTSPFAASTPFTAAGTTAGACEVIAFGYVNREERGAQASGADFSPPPPAGPASTLCWEANVISIRGDASSGASLVLGSQNVRDIAITTGAQNGWGTLRFDGTNATTTGLLSTDDLVVPNVAGNFSSGATVAGLQRFLGLPTVGFMVRTFNNGSLTCGAATCQGNYASGVSHNYTRTITPTP
jgi:hypothetical protein